MNRQTLATRAGSVAARAARTWVRCGLMLLMVLGLSLPVSAEGGEPPGVIAVKAGRVHTMTGDAIDHGVVIIRDGVIEVVGRDVEIPAGAEVIELPDGVITPGLIDACCMVDFGIPEGATGWLHGAKPYSFWRALSEIQPEAPDAPSISVLDREFPAGPVGAVEKLTVGQPAHATWADQAYEVTPHRRVVDSLNLLSNDFARLLRGGVTMAYISPDSANVIGGRGAVVKTAGPLGDRVVCAAGAVKATMGGDPIRRGLPNYLPPMYGPTPNFHTRRPTTRMGVDWVFRKAFFDAAKAQAGEKPGGADAPPPPALPVLQQVLEGRVPLRIQARMQHDIFSALRLAEEFKLNFILEEGTEAYRCLPQLQAAGVPVVFGPLYMTASGYRGRTDEARRPRLTTPRQLADAGIAFALTAQELRDEEGLVRQAMVAVRHGLDEEEALRSITTAPAAMLGLSGKVGELSPGAAADLVVWSGEPLSATSRPKLVVVGGEVVYELE